MDLKKKMKQYAELVVRTGVNVQPGQEVLVMCTTENADFCRMLVKEAYQAGAKSVFVRWKDDKISRLHYDYMTEETLAQSPAWELEVMNHIARNRGALISVVSSNPEMLKGVDTAKLMASNKRSHELTKEFDDTMDKNEINWNIVAVPGKAWAKKVFPDSKGKDAIEKLWDAILHVVRMDKDDPVAAWQSHGEKLTKKAEWLTSKEFVKLHYTNSLGTDFTVGLVERHIWVGGGDQTVQGTRFYANMPTEEVFTMPHADQADGIVKSAIPLSYQGTLITDFSLTFKGGKVVDFTAEEGYDALKCLLDTDEGSRHLGEVALVPYDSPISNLGILFYSTLFDENASCHLALGACYPDTIQEGETLGKEALRQLGGNDSINHVDFMVGTKDLKIVGTELDGTETVIFVDGNWAV